MNRISSTKPCLNSIAFWLLRGIPLAVGIGLYCVSQFAVAQTEEYKVKLAFIEKLTSFVEWPAHSYVHDQSLAFRFCVMGTNPFGSALQDLGRLTHIKGKDIEIKLLVRSQQISGCDLLFVARNANTSLKTLQTLAVKHAVLLVSDSPGYARRGITINFFPQQDSLGFEINLESARAAGIIISSRLLKLARIVGEGDPP